MGVGRGLWEEMSLPEEGKIAGNSSKSTGGHFGIIAGKRQASCLTDSLSLVPLQTHQICINPGNAVWQRWTGHVRPSPRHPCIYCLTGEVKQWRLQSFENRRVEWGVWGRSPRI